MSKYLSAYSKNLHVDTIAEIENMNNVTQSFEEAFAYTGVGFISCFELRINNQGVRVRFEVDGTEIFDIDAEEIYNNLREFDGVTREIFVTNQPIFVFQPKNAVLFKEGFKIQVKSNDNGNWKDLNFGYVMYEGV